MKAGLNDPDLHARRSASHYCVYLIMRGIQILGASLVSPTNDPDQFVSALIDADLNTASSTPLGRLFSPLFFPRVPPILSRGSAAAYPKSSVGPSKRRGCTEALPTRQAIRPRSIFSLRTFGHLRNSRHMATFAYGAGSYNPVSLKWNQNQGPQMTRRRNGKPIRPRSASPPTMGRSL